MTTEQLAKAISDAIFATRDEVRRAYAEEMHRKLIENLDPAKYYDIVDRRMAKRYGEIIARWMAEHGQLP